MPWLAIPLEDEERIMEHKRKYNIKGIPSLVVLGSKGELISVEGRREIMQKGENAFADWMQIYEEVKLPDEEPEEGEGMGLERVDEV
jgi:nucleoredoxin